MFDGSDVLVKAPFEGSGMPLEVSLLQLAPSDRACGSSCARHGGRIKVGEAKLTGGSGEKVEGSKAGAAP